MNTYDPLFEGAAYCARCCTKLRSLGLMTVACDHASLTLGVDNLSSGVFNDWHATQNDLRDIARLFAKKENPT